MFDLGWQEFILIALVAVVVVGPKDLPRVIRTVGQWIRKARSLASEFQGSLEEMAREAELDDVRKSIQEASRGGVGASIEKHVDPDGDIRRSIEEARDSSGADEIGEAVAEARRDTQALASSGGTASGPSAPETPAPATPAPATPAPATPAAGTPAAGGATPGGPAAQPAAEAVKPAARSKPAGKAPAKSSAAKDSAAGKTASRPAAAKPAADKAPARAKRTTRKPAAGDAGEA